jgi:hypothetical protein
VKQCGLSRNTRYIPTNLSKAILLLLPGAAWFVFSAVREHPDWFGMSTWSSLEKTLCAALVASGFCLILIIVLVLDMAVAIHHSKHRRIIHYSNQHPSMSMKFLLANASVPHWLGLGFFSAFVFGVGYFLGSP